MAFYGMGLSTPLAQTTDGFYDPQEDQTGARFEIDDIGRLLLGFGNRAYQDLSEQLFDHISTHDIGVEISDYTTVMGRLQRKVYNNRDGTYSVLDLCGIKGVVAPGEMFDVGGVPLYGAIGSEIGADFIHIRQYDDKLKIGYAPAMVTHQDPWYQELWEGIRERWFGFRYIFDIVNAPFNFLTGLYRSPSGEFMPRYENILNVVSPPFRMPLSAKDFNNMDPGEIFSYTITGGVFLSLSSGYSVSPFSGQVGINWFKRGAVRITILKERSQRGDHAKIRLTHLTSDSKALFSKIKGEWDILEGVIFGSDLSVSFVPFRVSVEWADIEKMDQVFSYDMNDRFAQEAYEKAVLGNFIQTQELAKVGASVQWQYDRNTQTESKGFFNNYNLLIWKHKKGMNLSHSLITIKDREGVRHVFASVSRNDIKSGNFFRSSAEKFEYFVETNMSLDNPVETLESKDPVVLIALFATDRHAFGYEIREHLQMIEAIVGEPRLFEEGRYDSKQDYRKISLQFEIRFNLEAVDDILSANEDHLWKILAGVFHVDPQEWATESLRDDWVSLGTYLLSIRNKRAMEKIKIMKQAMDIVDYFSQIKKEKDHKKRAALFSEFHHDMGFQWKVLSALLSLSKNKHAYYRVNFFGPRVLPLEKAWGQVIEVNRPHIYDEEDRGFDGKAPLKRASVSDIQLLKLSDKHPIVLSFKTNIADRNVQGIWLQVHRIRFKWFRGEKLYQTANDKELFQAFRIYPDGMGAIYLSKLPIAFEEDAQYEVAFSLMDREGVFSVQPTFKFTFEDKAEMELDWIDILGESEILD